MFNLVLNHHCLHIAKGGGGSSASLLAINRALINAFRPTINAPMTAKLLTKHAPLFTEEVPKTGVQGER